LHFLAFQRNVKDKNFKLFRQKNLEGRGSFIGEKELNKELLIQALRSILENFLLIFAIIFPIRNAGRQKEKSI